tara:strand:- start:168 stop:935 length:768 start_codon:yes stop_codon:yes gene_type:complete
MVDIRKDISRLKRSLVYTKFFDCLLDGVVVSLIISAILFAFGLSIFYSSIFGGVYLIFGFVKSAKSARLSEIEKKVPDLEWQLRTAADNVGKRNEMVDRLNNEVAEKIGFIGMYDLLSGKKTLKRVMVIMAMISLMAYMNYAEFSFVDSFGDGGNGDSRSGLITGLFSDKDPSVGDLKDILGEEGILELGTDDLEIELGTEANEIDLGKEGDIDLNNEENEFEGDVDAIQDSSFDENIDIGDKEIVERFYNNLNK